MRQLIIFLLTFFIFSIGNLNCYSAINGSIEYQIPFDYSKFTKEELEQKAQEYYNLAIVSKSLDSNMTNAIIFYRILCRKYPDNTIYYTKVGVLYDILGKDKQAKGCVS